MKKVILIFIAIAMIASFSLKAQMAVTTDGSSADGSAMFEIKSTNKGFLPPRMTMTQRDAIHSPVATGLVVWCTNCGSYGELQVYNGSAWTNMMGGSAAVPLPGVGDYYQSGIIAYVFQSGDPGYVEGENHGLIASMHDESTGITWFNVSSLITGATATELGTGNANTNTIVSEQGDGSYAAKRCYDLIVDLVHDDWYLPSKDELNKLFVNRVAVGNFDSGEWYWSSTEASLSSAYRQYFGNGSQGSTSKSSSFINVRCIRSF